MQIKKISETITTVGDKVRIEIGPERRRELATAELLDDAVTAAHYKAGEPDALGKPIVLGKPFDFIDWQSKARAWYVYELADGVWQPRSAHTAEDAALTAAVALAAG